MDAFSLALIYGTQGIAKKDKLLLSLIVAFIAGAIVGHFKEKRDEKKRK